MPRHFKYHKYRRTGDIKNIIHEISKSTLLGYEIERDCEKIGRNELVTEGIFFLWESMEIIDR